jgi:predicted AAA+ superfamily ATPase
MPRLLPRLLEGLMKETIKTRPLVYLNGMRQCGKSTLVKNLSIGKDIQYITFDNPVSLSFAKNDPAGFIQQLPQDKLNIIDEVQLAPELFRYFKIAVDENRLTGKNSALYVLTGSSNIFALPSLADALVGRMAILTLYPFSVSETKKTGVNFLEKLFAGDLAPAKYQSANIVDIISSSTFPEIALNKKKDRYVWFNDYLTTILQRDVRTLADIKNPDSIYQLLVSLAQRAGGLLNNTNIMKETGLDAKTYEKYKALCVCTFLVFELQSWSKPNKLDKRFVKQKKLYFSDTNLLCHILQRDIQEIYKNDRTVMGHVFENFIACEIMKAAKSLVSFSVSHFNPVQNQGKEVDFVIESPNGKTIGIEVKLDGTINDKDYINMMVMQETIGKSFLRGIIIYTGTELMQVRKNIWAVPVGYLWKE